MSVNRRMKKKIALYLDNEYNSTIKKNLIHTKWIEYQNMMLYTKSTCILYIYFIKSSETDKNNSWG